MQSESQGQKQIIKHVCYHSYRSQSFSWMSHVYYIFLIDLQVANPGYSNYQRFPRCQVQMQIFIFKGYIFVRFCNKWREVVTHQRQQQLNGWFPLKKHNIIINIDYDDFGGDTVEGQDLLAKLLIVVTQDGLNHYIFLIGGKVVFLASKRGKYLQKQIREKILQTQAYQKEMSMSKQIQLQRQLRGFFTQSKPIKSDSNPQLLLQFLDIVPQKPRKQETPERIHPLLKKALELKTKTSIMADQLIGQTRRCKNYNEIAEQEDRKKAQKLHDDLLNRKTRNPSKKTKRRCQPRRKRDSARNSDESEQKGYGPPYKVTILTKQQLYSELDKRKNDKNRIHAGSRSRSKDARKIVKEIVQRKKRIADKSREQKNSSVQHQSKDSSMTVVEANPLQKLKEEKVFEQETAIQEQKRYHDHLFGKPRQNLPQKKQDTYERQLQYSYRSSLLTTTSLTTRKDPSNYHNTNQLKSQIPISRHIKQVCQPNTTHKVIVNSEEISQKQRILEQKRKLVQQNERLEKLLKNIEQTQKNTKNQDQRQIVTTKIQQNQRPLKKQAPITEDRSQSRSSLSNKQQYPKKDKHSNSSKHRDYQSPRSPKKDYYHNYRNYRQQSYGKHQYHQRTNNSSSKKEYSPSYNKYQPEPDWRKELREVTHYNPHDRKYRERDRMTIQESNFRRINKQEAFSRKMGQIEEQKQLLREKSIRRKY